ncbi:MAG: hypothetical protein JJT75_05030 [Opitutales bacterium]|nr:hypothetical protein [Opitutales bacterium]MCH8541091.1 hypothetical protein [Opitutales bacterium]
MIVTLLREYLEGYGLRPTQKRLWLGGSRRLPAEERVFLSWMADRDPQEVGFYLFSNQISSLPAGFLWVYPPLLEGFSSSVVRKPDQLLKFVQGRINKNFQKERDLLKAESGDSNPFVGLLVPAFPLREPQKGRMEKLLSDEGISGVFSLRSVMLDLVAKIDSGNKFYENPAMEIIRLFKAHDLLSEPQMRIFE